MARNAMRAASVLLLVAALYWPDTAALGRYWLDQDVNAQAGVLVALLSAFLLYRAREQFERVPVEPVPWACLPLIACAAASLICWRAGILTLQLFFLPLILWLALLSLLGPAAARVAGFPIGFLYFGLPGWGLLGPALQRLTAGAVGVIGPMVGLPVTMSGTTALLPGGIAFVVERNCSGVDFLTIGLAVAMLQGELERAGLRRRAGLLGAMILLAIASNWVRVLLIIDIGYRSHMRSALATHEHLAFGWVIFACSLLIFVWLAGRTAGVTGNVALTPESSGALDAVRASSTRGHAVWRYAVVAAALLAVPALVYAGMLATEPLDATTFELPQGHMPWHGPADLVDPLWQPQFIGAHAEQQARYESADGRTVEIVAIGFAKQRKGAQILNEGNSLLGNRGLAIEAVSLVEGAGIPHGEVIAVDPRGRRSLIWSVIDIGGRLFGEPLSSQLWYGARSLIGTPYSALFALRTDCDGSCDAARATLADFLRVNGAALFGSLPETGIKD